MIDQKITGNEVTNDNFTQVLLTLKENIMYNINVSELLIVESIDSQIINCVALNNNQRKYKCYKLKNLELTVNDVVLVVFTNSDFRINLKRLENDEKPQNNIMYCNHSNDYGIIVGIIDIKGEEENATEL